MRSAITVTGVILAAVAGWFATALIGLSFQCDGDGGTAHAEPGSAADHFCRTGTPVAGLAPLAGVLLGRLIAGRRDPDEQGWWIAAGPITGSVIASALVAYGRGLSIDA